MYANNVEKTETDETIGEAKTERIPFLKAYTVFNAEQVEGLPGHYDATIANYSPGGDFVQVPPFESFHNSESYYATLAHECTHWTKHESRLQRSFASQRFGDDGYATEELVAELGAAFVCADLGITPEVMPEQASYLAAWLTVLPTDSKAIFTAAAHAERAAAYLAKRQQGEASH